MVKFTVFGDLYYDEVSDGAKRVNELVEHIRTVKKEIVVEPELHEWLVDKTNSITSSEQVAKYGKEFQKFKGVYPEGQDMKWESLASLRECIRRVADKYADYDKVIIVGHGMAFRVLKYIERTRLEAPRLTV